MDIQKLREGFEDKFQIKMMLYQLHGKIAFIDEINDYRPTITNQGELTENEHRGVAWIQGAWYAFQEQQKQIDEIKAIAESWINQDYTHNSDSTDIKIQQMKDCGRDIIRKINGE